MRGRSSAQAVLFGHEHSDDLPSESHESSDGLCLGIGQGTWSWVHSLGEVSQDVGIDGIGLGQLAGGLGEVPDLARVDHYDWEARGGQSPGEGCLQTSRSLQDDQGRVQTHQAVYQVMDAIVCIGDLPVLATRANGNV